jgi:hypothetical protein
LAAVHWLLERQGEVRRRVSAAVARRSRRGTFRFDGTELPYAIHAYNTTWRNERAVELPIALAAYERGRTAGASILEVGNVLAHYGHAGHAVLDKYEQAAGVRNMDVMDLPDDERYDLIVSISTIEHMGLDEDVREPDKPARATERLTQALNPGGELLATFPMGYNADLDDLVRRGGLPFGEVRFLRRRGAGTDWEEVESAAGARYGDPYEAANVVGIGRTSR